MAAVICFQLWLLESRENVIEYAMQKEYLPGARKPLLIGIAPAHMYWENVLQAEKSLAGVEKALQTALGNSDKPAPGRTNERFHLFPNPLIRNGLRWLKVLNINLMSSTLKLIITKSTIL